MRGSGSAKQPRGTGRATADQAMIKVMKACGFVLMRAAAFSSRERRRRSPLRRALINGTPSLVCAVRHNERRPVEVNPRALPGADAKRSAIPVSRSVVSATG
ncbi:hypothetical protein GCM10009527_042740 [Actinomadura nitritigenes]